MIGTARALEKYKNSATAISINILNNLFIVFSLIKQQGNKNAMVIHTTFLFNLLK